MDNKTLAAVLFRVSGVGYLVFSGFYAPYLLFTASYSGTFIISTLGMLTYVAAGVFLLMLSKPLTQTTRAWKRSKRWRRSSGPTDDAGTRSAALLVLMATLESSSHPKAFANAVKHFAFTRCGELDLYGMVDAQAVAIEAELSRDLAVIS